MSLAIALSLNLTSSVAGHTTSPHNELWRINTQASGISIAKRYSASSPLIISSAKPIGSRSDKTR